MAPYDRFYLTTESETEQEADAERGKYRLRRVVADVLLAAVLKAADVTARIIPNPFRVAAIFIGHCARGKVEIFHRFGGVGRATLWFAPACGGIGVPWSIWSSQPYISLLMICFIGLYTRRSLLVRKCIGL